MTELDPAKYLRQIHGDSPESGVIFFDEAGNLLGDDSNDAPAASEPEPETKQPGLPQAHQTKTMGEGSPVAPNVSPNAGTLDRAFDRAVSAMPTRVGASVDYNVTADVDLLELLSQFEVLDIAYTSPDYKGTLNLVAAHMRSGQTHFCLRVNHVGTNQLVGIVLQSPDPAQLHQTLVALHELMDANTYVAPPDRAKVTAWWMTGNGPTYQTDYIEAPTIEEAMINYPPPVAGALEKLVASLRKNEQRVHVWYGPPGTGKTSMVRTIAHDLIDDLDVHIVMDPEQLLKGGVAYMLQIVARCKRADKGYLLILEDAGQMLTVDAGQIHGEALGRILNITDGILGQNAKISVLITTNEPVGKLHPALLRPGRCGSQIDFRPFTRAEAKVWCADHDMDPSLITEKDYTLAELYALGEDQSSPVRTTPATKPQFGFAMDVVEQPEPKRDLQVVASGKSFDAKQMMLAHIDAVRGASSKLVDADGNPVDMEAYLAQFAKIIDPDTAVDDDQTAEKD